MSRSAYSIFCDDIRHELHGKISLIGVYDTKLLIPAFPTLIPKLCVLVTISTPLSEPFTEISIRGKLGDREIFSMSADKAQIQSAEAAKPADPEATHQRIQTMAMLSPVSFEGPGDITIEIVADGQKIECVGLQVRQMSDDDTQAAV